MGQNDQVAAELRALEEGAALLPLPDLSLLRVAGQDNREALHRVVSQDILGMRPGDGRLALLLAPKGQFQAIFAAFAADGAVYLLCPPGKGDAVMAGLDKYLRFSCSRVERVAVAAAYALLGPDWAELAVDHVASIGRLQAGGCVAGSARGESLWFGLTLLGLPGAAVASEDEIVGSRLADDLRRAGAVQVSAQAVELERISAGWPIWGAELSESVLPPEVGLDEVAISYTKGCYVGQETMARMKARGHPNRALVGLHQLGGDQEGVPLPLPLTAAGEERPRGALTSWARHPRLGGVGLALVRRELAAPGTRLAGAGRSIEVARLPLW